MQYYYHEHVGIDYRKTSDRSQVHSRLQAGSRLEAAGPAYRRGRDAEGVEGCGKGCGLFPFPQEVESGEDRSIALSQKILEFYSWKCYILVRFSNHYL